MRAGQQHEHGLRLRGTVSVYHPDYNDHGAVLFSLPATDGDAQTPGVHRNTLHTACAIIANNRFDGYISASRDPHAAHDDLDRTDTLPAGTYYFHLPRPLNAPALTPYPVVPSFRAWRYPHDIRIPGWEELNIQEDGVLGSAEAVLARDQACRITDSKEAIQAAHIVPKAEREWFALNSMPSYCRLDPTGGASIIDRSSNGILLRSDVHRLWDTYRLFFVPKSGDEGTEAGLVAHVTALSAELLELYHNVPLQELRGVSKEYFLARFAYGVLRQLRTFLQSGRDRWLVVQENDGSVKTSQYAAPACARFAEDQGGGRSSRSPTKSPSKSPKRKRDDAESCSADERETDREEHGESSIRKRQRHSAESVDSAIAGITDWVDGCVNKDEDGLTVDIDWVESDLDQSDKWSAAIELGGQGCESDMRNGTFGEEDGFCRGRQRLRQSLPE
ncbi:hypothetical protein LTR85_012146 [Meristemomyces frigidus]|nr:hypothetical protein LTR85_012146 [Meristemomyces frigidus]